MKPVRFLESAGMMTRVFLANPHMILVRPSLVRFLCGYMNKFHVRQVGKNLILHSHLPPMNSKAYSRFVWEHLIRKTGGPSHAQIAITNACPQDCAYCYNKDRTGEVMNTETIKKVAHDLKEMGVVWIGLTGGEPLVNKNIVEIVRSISGDCAVKLFTTGCTLTPRLASELKEAGLFSVSVSIDHWDESIHDAKRGYRGALREAVRAIEIFRSIGGIDVGVSSVLTPDMIRKDETVRFLRFLSEMKIHEAWLSEVKPSTGPFLDPCMVIEEADRRKLVELQDEYNRGTGMTVNYLGHFEGKECFGCNAGHKMIYVDAFGDVSPCVFTPMAFGNVRTRSVAGIFAQMRGLFPSDENCFINKNYELVKKHASGPGVLGPAESVGVMREVRFGEMSAFFRKYYGSRERQKAVAPGTVETEREKFA